MLDYFSWASLVYTISFLPRLAAAASSPLVPFTLEVPNGTTQHGNSRILCPPTTWRGMATFFLGNFVAHILTVKSVPGERLPVTICNMILALLFPTSGLMRGLNAIARCVRFGGSDLNKACRAGALCVVIRNSTWRPRTNDSFPVVLATRESCGYTQSQTATNGGTLSSDNAVDDVRSDVKLAAFKAYHPIWLKEDHRWWIFFDTIWGRATVNTLLFDIHGTYRLPRGYSFAVLPRNTIVVPRTSNIIELEENAAATPSLTTTASPLLRFKRNSGIASSGSVLKILASVFQLLFSYYTVYRHQGDQIQRWGYVSFFFTPLPYAIMSFCNSISNVLTPDYASLYMVHSEIMNEAKEAGGAFEGVVGRVVPLIGPVNDNGYRSGFATTWKGISPTSIKRAVSAALFISSKERQSPRTMTPATCTAFSKGVDNSYFLRMRSGENGVCSVHKVTLKSASDEELFDGTSKRSWNTRLADLRGSGVFWFSYAYYCCIRHPQRTARYIEKWNSNPRLPVLTDNPLVLFTYHPCVLLAYGMWFLTWSVCHPHRAGRAVQQWFRRSPYIKAWNSNPRLPVLTDNPLVLFTYYPCILLTYGIWFLTWSVWHPHRAGRAVQQWFRKARKRHLPPKLAWYDQLLRGRLRRIKPLDQITQPTVYYPCCSRFQRYDDPLPQKHLAAAITSSTHIISAPVTSDINYPSASSPRSTTGIT
ncbi:hypothetical protein MMC22_006160 [Lobaria immixta]|nr:hypothetical protein [Lobaria immixta]